MSEVSTMATRHGSMIRVSLLSVFTTDADTSLFAAGYVSIPEAERLILKIREAIDENRVAEVVS